MKQKKSSILDRLRHRFPPVALYRSDLEEIIRLATARGFKVRISDDRYEFESLDDLRENRGNRIKKLMLEATISESSYPSVDIEIDSDGITIRSPKDDKFVPLWHEIKDAIQARLPWYARLMKPLIWLYLAIPFLWVLSKRQEVKEGFELTNYLLVSGAGLSIFLGLISLSYLRRSRGLRLQRQHEVQGFWERYGEKIILLVIGTAVGIVGKVLSDKLTGK